MKDIKTLQIQSTGNEKLQAEIQSRLDNLTKPPGSLGMLEKIALQYCLCKNDADAALNYKSIHIFAADHGITGQGVSPFPSEVTKQMVQNMLKGSAAISVMSKQAGVSCSIVDMGIKGCLKEHYLLLQKKVAPGTADFSNAPAMTQEQCQKALQNGFSTASDLESDITAVGEMGIGNTSSASALYSLLFDKNGAETVGAGTGASGPLLEKKRAVIDKAVSFHRKEWNKTPQDALRRVGGFEIAGMTGYILGSATKRIPVVIDGFIATASALCAIRINPAVKDYLFFGHVSDESFHKEAVRELGVSPLLSLDMRLGEGTGAVLGIQIIEQALNCYHNMATFSSAGVDNRDS